MKKMSKDEREAQKLEKEAQKLQKEELERETIRTVVPLFIEKAKIKLGIAVFVCFIIAVIKEFVLNNNSSIMLAYVIVALITYAGTRKEWKSAKIESEQ